MRSFFTLAAVVLLAACSSAAAPAPGGPAAPSASGKAPAAYSFVLANPAGLMALDAKGNVVGKVLDLPQDSSPDAPNLFPDRKSIAFSITLVPQGSASFGSDIWVVNLDGSNLRKIVEHERENVFYAAPNVSPDGQYIYVHRRAAVMQNGTYVGNEDSIERVDATTGKMTRIVSNAADPTLSPDGKTLVYVRMEDGAPKGLWRVGSDGGEAKPFFSISDTWWYLQSPRFSPDGKTLVFCGAGHNAQTLAPGTKDAHLGIPSEIFLAGVDGKSVKSLTQTNDDTTPTWSPDGSRLIFVTTGAIQVLTLADGKVDKLTSGDTFFFGSMAWIKQ